MVLVVHGKKYWISKTNGLIPEKNYTFADDGKIIFAPGEKPGETPDVPVVPDTPDTPDEPDVVKDGIVAENGGLYYYVNGKLNYAGVIIRDGEYYYVNSSCQVITGKKYWISKTNGLLEEKSYTFAEDGRIIFAEGERPE